MKRLLDAIDRVIGSISALALIAGLMISGYAVVVRYLPITGTTDWVSEVTVFLVVWVVLLSTARVERRHGHLRVDFVLRRLTPAGQRRAEFGSLLLAFAVSGFLTVSGVLVVQEAYRWAETTDSSLRVPMWVYYASLSVAFGVHILFLIDRLIALLNGAPMHHESTELVD